MSRKRKASFASNSSEESPSKKAKLAEGLIKDPTNYRIEFQKGQITKMTLTNWVTFDHTVIDCEPGLNLIVGPNGTGKSSIVCAIGLGLAGKPKCLGRGEKASDFIKFGRDQAITKIELFNPNGRNYEITRVINKKGNNRDPWTLNGKKVSAVKVDRFVKDKLNIKVDNLCQFLAQDRVSEFARLTPKELLIETEKAIEDQKLFQYHQFLIEQGEKASTAAQEIDNLRKTLSQNEAEIHTLQKTIEQFESKKTMEAQMTNYQALHEWETAKKKHNEYKEQHKKTKKLEAEHKKKKANMNPLRSKLRTWAQKAQRSGTKHTKLMTAIKKTDKKRTGSCTKLQFVQTKIQKYQDDIKQAIQDIKLSKNQRKKFEIEVGKIENELAQMDEKEVDQARDEKNKIQRGDLAKLRIERNTIDTGLKAIARKQHDASNALQKIDQRLSNYTNSSQRKDSHIFNHKMRKEKRFYDWVNSQRHSFSGDVYGPIVREMTVKNETHATYLNNTIGQSTFYGYVCTNGADWETLLRQSKHMGLHCTIYTSTDNNNNGSQAYIQRPVDIETLRRNGVDGYLDQVFEAPDIIKQVLNDNHALHRLAFSMRDLDSEALDRVLVCHRRQPNRLNKVIMPSAVYTVKESLYSQQVMRKMNELRRHSQPFLVKTRDFSQEIMETQELKDKQMRALEDIQREQLHMRESQKSISVKLERLQDKKKECEQIIRRYIQKKKQLNRKRAQLAELEHDEGRNPEAVRAKYTEAIQKANVQRLDILDRLCSDTNELFVQMQEADACHIAKKHFDAERHHIEHKIKTIMKKHQELKRNLEESSRIEKNLKNQYQLNLNNAQKQYPRAEYINKWSEEDKALALDAIQDKINHLQGRINVLFIDEERVNRYRRLERKISKQKHELASLEDNQNEKTDTIKNIENKWKPQLQEAVDKISSKFGEFFSQFNKAEGRILLISALKDNNNAPLDQLPYSEWHIDIETKFREGQPWKRLTSSSQSGGEKSVSTMLYLLSLQQVTTVPFRVVDEINQGMDPINERRVMQILNYECTPAARHINNKAGTIRHLPQYFVVTPKLLPRLQYSPCSNVFVIFNGPFQMPQEYWKLKDFIQSQQALTASQVAVNDEDETSDDNDEEDEYESE